MLIELLKDSEFFKSSHDLRKSDLKELANNFNLLEVPHFQSVYEYGDIADTFYMIVQGIVCIYVPNPKVKSWEFQRK